MDLACLLEYKLTTIKPVTLSQRILKLLKTIFLFTEIHQIQCIKYIKYLYMHVEMIADNYINVILGHPYRTETTSVLLTGHIFHTSVHIVGRPFKNQVSWNAMFAFTQVTNKHQEKILI